MKKILSITFSLLCFMASFAQYKSGTVEYGITAIDVTFKEGNPGNDMVKSLVEMAKAQKYELKFNSNFSRFITLETLDSEKFDQNLLLSAKAVYGSTSSYFLDHNKKEIVNKNDGGVLVKSNSIKSTDWKILTETKTIGTYLCYKATYSYEFINRNNETKTKTITAWFAPSLPFSYGPIEFHGLPGLILELNKDYTTFSAQKIVLVKEEIEIDFPKGKTISQDEYEKKLMQNSRY